jgi:hypothetical protein
LDNGSQLVFYNNMAANVTPIQDSKLLSAIILLVKGCQKLETELGIKQNTSAALQNALDDAQESQRKLKEQKKALSVARQTFQVSDRLAKKTISNCRLRLAMLYGQEFNIEWEKVGFPDRSTAVPESLEKRQALLLSLEKHFQCTQLQESKDMEATAEACRSAWNEVNDCRIVIEKETKLRSRAVRARNDARLMLKKRYRSLIVELGVLISPDDPKWKEFGLNPPARKRRTKLEMETAAGSSIEDEDPEDATDTEPTQPADEEEDLEVPEMDTIPDEPDEEPMEAIETPPEPEPVIEPVAPPVPVKEPESAPSASRTGPAKGGNKRRATAQLELLLPSDQPPETKDSSETGEVESAETDAPF